jgi:hypothetical protein
MSYMSNAYTMLTEYIANHNLKVGDRFTIEVDAIGGKDRIDFTVAQEDVDAARHISTSAKSAIPPVE